MYICNLYHAYLQEISHDYHDMAGNCLTALLEHWLTQANPVPSWSNLIEVLRSPFLGRHDIATKIEIRLPSDHTLNVLVSGSPENY